MSKPVLIFLERREFMAETNINRLVGSGLRAAAAAHPGCIDQSLITNIIETVSYRIIESYNTNPTDNFMSEERLEHILVKALRKSDGIAIPVLGGSIAKRIRMALLQSYESRIRGLDTSEKLVYDYSSEANLIDALVD
tara:strand:+ start:3411 stop:3824 length:414 start_codon:yes stop_codon:yes gene_type:complete